MTSASPRPAYDPRRIEEIRTANETSKGYIGQRGYCDDCDFLLVVLDAHHDVLKGVKEAMDIAYLMDCQACGELSISCSECRKITAAWDRLNSFLTSR
jgi:hypothetical protein